MLFHGLLATIVCAGLTSATIWQNGQVRQDPYSSVPTITLTAADTDWRSYPANASQLSYKGRWDSKYVSWWSAPGLKFGYTGDSVAIGFGELTSEGVLVGWRISGQDWNFANVSASMTYQFVDAETPGQSLALPGQQQTFEIRVSNYAYGIQIDKVWVECNATIQKLPTYPLKIEMIGDSLTAGAMATYETMSGYAWGLCQGFGDIEFDITAYPGICLHDQYCWGNLHGMTYQYHQTSDTSYRSQQIWGSNPEPWKFAAHQKADIVVINIGTNDNNGANGGGMTSPSNFTSSYINLINVVHNKYPKAQIIVMSLWGGFYQHGNTWLQDTSTYYQEIIDVVNHYNTGSGVSFVRYYNTTGIMQHNDIDPLYHPTDVGYIKVASHLKQYIKDNFGWVFSATGPEVYHDTLYWNDQVDY